MPVCKVPRFRSLCVSGGGGARRRKPSGIRCCPACMHVCVRACGLFPALFDRCSCAHAAVARRSGERRGRVTTPGVNGGGRLPRTHLHTYDSRQCLCLLHRLLHGCTSVAVPSPHRSEDCCLQQHGCVGPVSSVNRFSPPLHPPPPSIPWRSPSLPRAILLESRRSGADAGRSGAVSGDAALLFPCSRRNNPCRHLRGGGLLPQHLRVPDGPSRGG